MARAPEKVTRRAPRKGNCAAEGRSITVKCGDRAGRGRGPGRLIPDNVGGLPKCRAFHRPHPRPAMTQGTRGSIPQWGGFQPRACPGGRRRSKHQRDKRLQTFGHHPPLAIPFLAPNPVFEINPRGVGLRASPCRRVDSGEPNAPGDVSQSSGLRGPVARGMVPRLQDRSQTDVPQRCSRLRVNAVR
jgi:hypothetical protein